MITVLELEQGEICIHIQQLPPVAQSEVPIDYCRMPEFASEDAEPHDDAC